MTGTLMARADSNKMVVGTGLLRLPGLSKYQNILWLALIALMATSVHAQRASGLSAEFHDSRTLNVQRKVDELYENGEFDRAYFIYRNELVPIGDKYAQYMVGHMHLTGMGIDEDTIAASAWFRLAAERGTPEFVAVRDQLIYDFDDEQRRRSDAHFLQLRREFSDMVILLASIKRDLGEVESRTGTRLAAESSPVTVVDLRAQGGSSTGAVYYGRIRQRLEARLNMLSKMGDFPDLETDPTRVNIDHVERLVNERIESTPDQL
jgi:hypothetical protein